MSGASSPSFICKWIELRSSSKWKDFCTRNVASQGYKNVKHMISHALCNFGERELVMTVLQMRTRGVSHASWCCSSSIDFSKLDFWKRYHFCNPIYLPQLASLAFFVPSCRVLLDLQPFECLFFSLAFAWISYLTQTLFLPRPQIRQLGTFVSLPSYLICQD